MSLDNLQLEQYGKGEKVRENVLNETFAELQDLSKQVQDVANEKGQKFAESIQITTQLEADVGEFIRAAANNELDQYTGEFNAKNFDIDGEAGLDQFEFERFAQSLDSAIDQIILLDGIDAFSDVHADSASASWYEVDKHTAKALNKLTDGVLDSMIGDDKDGSLAEKLLNGLDISDSEIHQMREKDFSIKSRESWKELGILLALEMGEGVEDMIRFLINIPSAVVLIPRYLNLRVQLNSNNPKEAAEAEIMLDELVEQNLALGLLNLLGEDGIQAIKSIATMMTSGKQGDIALSLVSIAGLFAGGAGAVRLGAKMGKMSKLENAAARAQRGAERVDDVVGQAGIGHLTGGFNPAETPPSLANSDPLAAEPRFDQATLQKNANLSPADRQAEASRILGRPLTPEQKRAILEAHEIGSSEVGKYSSKELVAKRRILTTAGFTKSEANQLMDKGIAGAFERMRKPKLKYHQPFKRLDTREVAAGDTIVVKTENGSEYSFTVIGEMEEGVPVRWNHRPLRDGRPFEGLITGSSGNSQIKLGEPLFIGPGKAGHLFAGSGNTSRITEIQVQPGGKRANAPETKPQSSPKRSPESVPNPNVSNFSIGQNVVIPRSDNSQSVAQITEFMPDGYVKVEWTEGNERLQKIVAPNELKTVPQKIEDVNNFESLEFYLKSLPEGGIRGYSADELINLVRQVRKGELTSDYITRTGGLRGKVNELLSTKTPSRSINKNPKLEYHKPFDSVDARDVLVDDVISVKTRNGSEYNFTVIGRVGDEIYVRWEGQFGQDGKPVEGVVGGLSGNNQIELGKPLFIGSANTSDLTGIQIKPAAKRANISEAEAPNVARNAVEINRIPSIENYPRKNDVLAIGDIHGNYEIMLANLRSANVIDRAGDWIGGSRELVFHGDILGDRGTTSLQAMEHIAKLKKQAKQQGGEIQVLAGNHDDFAIAFLTSRKVAGGRNFYEYDNGTQVAGAYEFLRYIERGDITNKLDLFGSDVSARDILPEMRKSAEGRAMLENICEMKLCHQIDDTLFVHTDLTEDMANMLLHNDVNTINNTYKRGLRALLLGEGEVPRSFDNLNDVFLKTENRKYLSPQTASLLKEHYGINRVLHGHSNKNGTSQNIGGLEITSVDLGAGKAGTDMDKRSLGVIGHKNGALQVGR